MTKKEANRKAILNGGRGGGQTFRRLFEYYEGKVYTLKERINELKSKVAELECVVEEDGKAIRELLPLIKENAKLKLSLEALEGQMPWKDIKDKSEVIGQLTKAKEYITAFMRISSASVEEYEPEFSELIGKAEQFLKE